MSRLFIAANYVGATWFLPGNNLNNSGHLQIVYEDDLGNFLEVEVQSPSAGAFGDWAYPAFGLNHSNNTPYINDDVSDFSNYERVELSLGLGQTVDDVWDLMSQVHASFISHGQDINYDRFQNDLPPEAPSFIMRVCGFGFHILHRHFGQARRVRSPQFAQAHGALQRVFGFRVMSAV